MAVPRSTFTQAYCTYLKLETFSCSVIILDFFRTYTVITNVVPVQARHHTTHVVVFFFYEIFHDMLGALMFYHPTQTFCR